jgi:hypothetical protein
MSNVTKFPTPVLFITFDTSQEKFDRIIRRAKEIGRKGEIEFEIILTAPDNSTFTLTSRSTTTIEELRGMISRVEEEKRVRRVHNWFSNLFGIEKRSKEI